MQLNETSFYSSERESLVVSFQKLWKFKNLIWVFAKRDIQVKYAQTYLGFAWSVFKPLVGVCIYAFFGYLLNWSSGDIPYAAYVLTGLIGWNLFSYIIINGVSSIHESTDLIKKIYFPKSVLPLAKSLVGLFEALITLILVIPLLFYYDIGISLKLVFIPIVLIFNVACGLAAAFFIAAISIKKRDLLQVLPYLINLAIWLTPVFLSPNVFPKKFQSIFNYNPLANVIDFWRWVIFDGVEFQFVWTVNFAIIGLLLIAGFYFYSVRESNFADNV